MELWDTFLGASEHTRYIIIGTNLVFLVYYLISANHRNKIGVFGIAILAIGLLFLLVKKFSGINFELYFVYYQLPSLLVAILLYFLWSFGKKVIPKKPMGIFDIHIKLKNGKSITVNILKGVSVQGAAGSGKTISIAGWILYWLGKRSVPGLVYDYKDFELTEILLWLYKESEIPVHIFSPAEPSKSIQLNPLDPKLMKKQEDIILMSKCIVGSVFHNDQKGDSFFIEAAEGAITGAIIKLKEDYPQYCSFSYLVALFLTKDADGLVAFIESNANAARQARAFLDGTGSNRQMAGVKASLSNAFRVFDVRNILHCMQRNEIDIAINGTNTKSVLSLVNKPKYGDVYEPIFSIVAQSVILEMSQRDREPSFLLLDEAPTIRIPKIERIPATMRSFNIATIYMLQDKVQAANRLSLNKMKEVLANLSTLFFGKTNDPDTARFFESYFEEIKIKQKSISRKSGVFWEGGDARTTTSERDEKVHKSFEMFKRSTGQFFVFDENGKSYDVNVEKPNIELKPITILNSTTEWEVKKSYDTIMETVEQI